MISRKETKRQTLPREQSFLVLPNEERTLLERAGSADPFWSTR